MEIDILQTLSFKMEPSKNGTAKFSRVISTLGNSFQLLICQTHLLVAFNLKLFSKRVLFCVGWETVIVSVLYFKNPLHFDFVSFTFWIAFAF